MFILDDMKQRFCSVDIDFTEQGCREHPDVEYELPDGQIIPIPGPSLLKAPEIMFNPNERSELENVPV